MISPEEKLEYPVHINLELTNFCQLDCVCCPNSGIKRKRGFITWKILEKIVEESRGRIKTCHPHGLGEPLLHPDVFKMLSYIKDAGIRICFSTNALLLNREASDKLFGLGIDEIVLPLWSLKKETHESLRRGGVFETILRNINDCIQLRNSRKKAETKIILSVVLMDKNFNEFERIVEIYKPLLGNFGRIIKKDYSTFAKSVPNLYFDSKVPFGGRCKLPNWNMTTYWNGDVVLCCQDVDGFSKVGNVMEKSIREIWDGSQYEEYRKSIREGDFSENSFCGRCVGG